MSGASIDDLAPGSRPVHLDSAELFVLRLYQRACPVNLAAMAPNVARQVGEMSAELTDCRLEVVFVSPKGAAMVLLQSHDRTESRLHLIGEPTSLRRLH